MNLDGDVKKELPEVNHHVDNESNRFRNAAAQGGQDLSEKDELNNRIAGDVKIVRDTVSQARAALQVQQQRQQTQGSMVCWERFLHLRSLKVLLVENDDCTRHVVAALLCNCSYEVTEAANGFQAWKILEDLTNHIDLILTEVAMPGLSGIGLLCKIMSHKTRKTVPVIMMSSHDSMNLVFKCLSKGAVDFLVKPIRKNELKNLWQHVWRRCHSSSGSGSESGTQTQKSVKSKSVEISGNNSGSNDEDDNGEIGLNFGDGSDSGSGTQSSWTRQAIEVDSSRLTSPMAQLAKSPDSTCAQDIQSKAEMLVDIWVPMNATRKCLEQEEQFDDVVVGKLEIPGPRNLKLELECQNEDSTQPLGTKQSNLPGIGSNNISEKIEDGYLDLHGESPSGKQEYKAANLTGVITNTTDPQADSTEFEASNKVSKIPEINEIADSDTIEMPYLELSLKRLRAMKDTGTTVGDDRNVLRRSDSSAFSRYNTASNHSKASSSKTENDAPLNNISEVANNGTVNNIQSPSGCNPPNQSSNEGSNNIDMGFTTDNAFNKPLHLRNNSVTTPTVKTLHPSSVMQPIKNDIVCDAHQVVLDNADDLANMTTLAQTRGPCLELQVQHLHDHYSHHPVHSMQHHNPPSDLDDLTLKKMAAAAPHCGSSNVLGGPVEGITAYYILNGSASNSNHGSNGMNGGSTAVPTGGTNMESDTGLAGRSSSGDASGSGSGNRVDQNKSAQREAALTKFRQKRKERCFQKKVRYQNRKRLAEQRPRVRGQFVRQTVDEDTSKTTES